MLYHMRKLRRFISPEAEYKVRRAGYRFLPAKSSPVDAVFHCCAWKTGSQWVRLVLSDPRFYMATGLAPIGVFNSPEIEKAPSSFHVPRGSVVTNFFVSYETYQAVSKPANTRAFYVVRDPRDQLVSWYLSNRYSHRPSPRIEAWRKEMEGMNDEEGLLHTIDMFEEVRSRVKGWVDAATPDGDIVVVRFEDLTGQDQLAAWRKLLDELGLSSVSDELLSRLLAFYNVKRLQPPQDGKTDRRFEKYGGANSRRTSEYLTDSILDEFYRRYPNILHDFGYDEAGKV